MKIGIVCPYSFDAPGGVQVHVMDCATELRRRGHEVQVLAPASAATELPEWVTSVGDAIPVRFNGSVARLSFSTVVARKTHAWLDDGDFDVVHIHEPMSPSVGMLALALSKKPTVATFHAAMSDAVPLRLIIPVAKPLLSRLSARIAVSPEARRTLMRYHGGDAVVIPNGVDVATFRDAPQDDPRYVGSEQAPTIAFLGRLDEPRKGLQVLADAIPAVLEEIPQARFLIAGRGDAEGPRSQLAAYGDQVTFLGGVSDADKAALLASASCYVAPQTGGESFGIVLVEAMAAHTPVVASDLVAFCDVLGDGRYGALFSTGNPESLAHMLVRTLRQTEATQRRCQAADAAVERYDWSTVTTDVEHIYATAIAAPHPRLRDRLTDLFDFYSESA